MLDEVIADLLADHTGYRVIQQLPGIGPVLAAVTVANYSPWSFMACATATRAACTATVEPPREARRMQPGARSVPLSPYFAPAGFVRPMFRTD